jgi:hypothetical protein
MNRIDTDKDEKESDYNGAGRQNGGGLCDHLLHLRSFCSSVVGFLPNVETLVEECND